MVITKGIFNNLKKELLSILLFIGTFFILLFIFVIFVSILFSSLFQGLTLILFILFTAYICFNLIVFYVFIKNYIWRDLDWKISKTPIDYKREKRFEQIIGKEKVKLLKHSYEILFYYFSIYLILFTISGYWQVKNKSENNPKNNHDAIVLCGNGLKFKTYYGYGFNYLIEFFNQNHYSYNIYECDEPEAFQKIVENPFVTSLWIFGHGDHGSVNIGDSIYEYSRLREKNLNKDYIYQFHCNPGLDDSLASIVSEGRGYVNNKINSADSNYWNTYEILKSFDYDNNRVRNGDLQF